MQEERGGVNRGSGEKERAMRLTAASEQRMHLLSFYLFLSLWVHPSPLSPPSIANRSPLPSFLIHTPSFSLLFFLDFLTSMCSFSFSRHGWQRSMSTPSRMWSSCCWATRWDLVANTGRWMDRWTHRGRDHGGRCGGSVPIGFMNVPGSRERDFHFIRITG